MCFRFPLDLFRQHIYQEVRRQKFIFFLGVVRAEKLRKQRGRFAHASALKNDNATFDDMDTSE